MTVGILSGSTWYNRYTSENYGLLHKFDFLERTSHYVLNGKMVNLVMPLFSIEKVT
jgi:hypothetical protein